MSHFNRNLDALTSWTPDTAQQLLAVSIPTDYQRVMAADGTPTYCREVPGPAWPVRRLDWLGGLSTPVAAAESLVAALKSEQVGLGLSMGTGHAWTTFAARLGVAQILFIYEPDPAQLRMALDVCDLSDFLTIGKIILITGPVAPASESLTAFLTRHPGFEAPAVLHPLPATEGDMRNSLISAGEILVRRAVTDRHQLLNHLVTTLEEKRTTPLTGDPLAFTVAARYLHERPVHDELARRGITPIRLDHHTDTSIPFRIQTVVEHWPSQIIGDLFRSQLAVIPPEITIETWVPPWVGPAYWDRLAAANNLLGPKDRIVVHGDSHARRLHDLGIPDTQIVRVPLLALASKILTRKELVSLLPTLRESAPIALIGDLFAIDEASFGIDLPTHVAVFRAARDIILEDAATVQERHASDILRRAIQRAGITTGGGAIGGGDPALAIPATRGPVDIDPQRNTGAMFRMIRDVLIPTLPLFNLAEQIVKSGASVLLIGEWPNLANNLTLAAAQRTGQLTLTPFPTTPAAETSLWQLPKALLLRSPSSIPSPLAISARNAGVTLLSVDPAD